MERDYSVFDNPLILTHLFHPRSESDYKKSKTGFHELLIPVEEGITIGGRMYVDNTDNPNILFFHGNGEIVADYDDLGPVYNRLNINFIPVDYRGYGISSGKPSVSAMMLDSHKIYHYIKNLLHENSHSGPLIIMGRSLGSASALELISHYGCETDGLILESAFAYALPLLRLIGIDTDSLGVSEDNGFDNLNKIQSYTGPTLIIHAENDHIIPFSDGETLYQTSPSPVKNFLPIPVADHNTIFSYGLNEYLSSVVDLTKSINNNRR